MKRHHGQDKGAAMKTYKPDSVRDRDMLPDGDDHFSGIRVTSNLKQPTRRPRLGQSVCRAHKNTPQMSSYLALHRATLTLPVMSPPPRWALTPPFHPYLSLGGEDEPLASAIGGLFSVVLVSDRSAWELPSALPMESGLSSRSSSIERSPSLHSRTVAV